MNITNLITEKFEEARQTKNTMNSLTKEIFEKKQAHLQIQQQITTLQENLEIYKINIENQVYQIFEGKRSNKEQREAKFKELAKQDSEYTKKTNAIKELQNKMNARDIEIESLYNQLKATRQSADLVVAEIGLLTELAKQEMVKDILWKREIEEMLENITGKLEIATHKHYPVKFEL